MSNFNLELFLEQCKEAFGCELKSGGFHGGKYFNVKIDTRVLFFQFLIEELLKQKGEEILYGNNKKIIINSCIPRGKKGEPKKDWIPAATNDFHRALAICLAQKRANEDTLLDESIAKVIPIRQEKPEMSEEIAEAKKELETVIAERRAAALERRAAILEAESDWEKAPVEDVPNPDLEELLGYKKKDE